MDVVQGRLLQSDVATAMARSFSCYFWYFICGDSISGPTSVTVGDGFSEDASNYDSCVDTNDVAQCISSGLTSVPVGTLNYYWTNNTPAILQDNGGTVYLIGLTAVSAGRGRVSVRVVDGYGCTADTWTYIAVTAKPVINPTDLGMAMIGSNSVQITINGSGFGSSPTINLPPGFTRNSQMNNSDSQIIVSVNIAFSATIGRNNLSVTTAAGTSNNGTFTVDGPAQMVVQDDRVVPLDNYSGGTQARQVLYQVQNFSSSAAAGIPIGENFMHANDTTACNQVVIPIVTHCDGSVLTGTDGKFLDDWALLDRLTPAGCGITITDHWQWCGPLPSDPSSPVPFGTLTGFSHTDRISINGFEAPVPIPLQPHYLPVGTIILP